MADLDFPADPVLYQLWTAPTGVVYVWNGTAWAMGTFDSGTQELSTLGDIIDQIRSLLQDVDASSGQYRYSTDSIVLCLNQGMQDMYRLRPDLFLALRFMIPVFSIELLSQPIGIEEQYISPLIFYTVGLVQARDDEQTQDARAAAFLKTFKEAVLTVG